MEPDFERALTVVLGVGAIIMGVGMIVLALAFRSFAGNKPRLGLIVALVVFVFVCCGLLFALAYAAQR
ncbi:MAG TPA: hypothetical protein VF432_10415 [Thermoanaerobaculia bacterium]